MAKPGKLVYFHDSEFVDASAPFAIDFISIGIVPLDGGPDYYGISSEFNQIAAAQTNPWLKDNVLAKLPLASGRKTVKAIAADILAFLRPAREIELWAKNGAYDAYGFCQIFGGMNAMRAALKERGIDKVTFRDIDELRRAAGDPRLPGEPAATAHIAIEDARWDRSLYEWLKLEAAAKNPAGLRALNL